jgi:20S proteasome alpha/beta subunit
LTLIVGIKCKDGVVLGADGAATLGALGQQTVRQSTSKLYIVNHCVVVGVSGPVGLGQRIAGEVESIWTKKQLSGKKTTDAMTFMRLQLWNNILNVEHQVAAVAKNSIGQLALQDTLASTLVALPISGNPCLIQFDQQGAPEEADDKLPFVAIGSGQAMLIRFLRSSAEFFGRKPFQRCKMGSSLPYGH